MMSAKILPSMPTSLAEPPLPVDRYDGKDVRKNNTI